MVPVSIATSGCVCSLALLSLTVACGSCGASSEGGASVPSGHGGGDVGGEGDSHPGVEPRPGDGVLRTATVTGPNEPGEAGCADVGNCTLTAWTCSPCGTCPDTRMRAVLSSSLEAQRASCQWNGLPGLVPECERCPDPDPGFLQWTSVACIDGRCVAHTLEPAYIEASSDTP